MEPIIEARALTKRYGAKVAVAQLDLAVTRGEVFGLLGPNGAGKTTTILMLLGLTEPDGGTARVAGLDPWRQSIEVKRLVGYLPDAVGFYGSMTGRQNLAYTARLNRLAPHESAAKVDHVLREVGLLHAADERVQTYSRGMRQRLGIADALVKDPEVLILDEPTMAIDPEGVVEIQRLIRRLADERGAAVLVSSHLLHQMQQICDRVGIFVSGRLVREGETRKLLRNDAEQSTFEVEVDGPLADVDALLEAVPGVAEVARINGHVWRVAGAADLAPRLSAAVVGAGFALMELRALHGDLDEVYRRQFEARPEVTV